MKKIILGILVVIALGVGAFVATADSKEERAVKQLASAQQLIAGGDTSRALVELRNALQNDPANRDARILFGELLLNENRRADAFAQFRQIIERDPDDIDAARALAGLAFDNMSWKDAGTYADTVLAKAPDDAEMRAVRVGIDYRDAVEKGAPDEMEAATVAAQKLLDVNPGLLRARRVLIADAMRTNELARAQTLLEAGLAGDHDNRDLNNTLLLVLERQQKTAEMEQQLLSMVALYPEDQELGQLLVKFYVATGRLDEAERLLRARITPDGTDPMPRMVLLRFIAETRSPEAMRTELAQVLDTTPLPADVAADPTPFKALLAQSDFVTGERDKAQAALEAIIKGAEPSAEIDRIKVELARMRQTVGNSVGARALVEEVLTRDPRQTEAIKMKASWLIDDDKTEPAIALLRDALSDAPNDAQIMTLMARAYEREGNPALMTDMLSRAVEVSNQAPAESLRYAGLLMQRSDFTAAESVLIDALRRQPQSLELLVQLARAHIGMQDWLRADQDIQAIGQRFDSDIARTAASELRVQLLSARGQTDQLSEFLDSVAQGTGSALAVRGAQIRSTIAAGNTAQALTEAEAMARDFPESAEAALLVAQLQMATGQEEAAAASLRAVTTAHPDSLQGWLMRQSIELRAGRPDAAKALIDEGLTHLPESPQLQLSKAVVLEREGRIDDAIAIYEAMYEKNSNDLVVANNLASLLAATRSDDASTERAWIVARRLNGTKVPAFQDTYGWIAFRRGDMGQALPALEAAAQGLPRDPSVAYHLGRVYAATSRPEDAKAQYDRADALLAQGIISYPALPQELAEARAALK